MTAEIQPETVTKFRALDGVLYDSEELADKANAAWKEENEWDLESEIEYLRFQHKRFVKTNSRLNDEYPYIMTWKDKHGDTAVIVNSDKGLLDAAWFFFSNHMSEYGYYTYLEGKWEAIAKRIQETEDKVAAFGMLKVRSDEEYEYEEVEIDTYVKSF